MSFYSEETTSEKSISDRIEIKQKSVFLHNIDDYQMNAISKRLLDAGEEYYELFGCLSSITEKPILEKDPIVRDYLEDIDQCSGDVGQQLNNIIDQSYENEKCCIPISLLDRNDEDYINKITCCDVIIYDIGVRDPQQAFTDIPKVIHALHEWSSARKLELETKMTDAAHECLLEANGEEEECQIKTKYFILISTLLTWADTLNVKKHQCKSGTSSSSTSSVSIGNKNATTVIDTKYYKRKPHQCYQQHKNIEQIITCVQDKCYPFVQTLILCPGVTYGGVNDKLQFIFQKALYNQQVPVFAPGNQLIPLIYLSDFTRMLRTIIDEFPDPQTQYIFAVQPDRLTLMDLTKNIARGMTGSTNKIKLIFPEEMMCLHIDMFPQILFDVLCVNLKIKPTKLLSSFAYESSDDEEFWKKISQEYRDAYRIKPLKIIIESNHGSKVPEHDRIQIIELTKELAKRYKMIYLDFSLLINYWNERIGALPIVDSKTDLNREIGVLCDYHSTWLIELHEICQDFRMDNPEEGQDEEKSRFETIETFICKLLRSEALNKNQGYITCCLPLKRNQIKDIFGGCLPTHCIQINTGDCTPNQFSMLDIIPVNYYSTPAGITQLFCEICNDLGDQYAPKDREEEENCFRNAEETKIEEEKRVKQLKKLAEKARKDKLRKWSEQHERIKQEQDTLCEIKTLPLREYLKKYVIPIVTAGLLRVCEAKPRNPVDFLAEYLVNENPCGSRVPSKLSEQQRTKFHKNVFC